MFTIWEAQAAGGTSRSQVGARWMAWGSPLTQLSESPTLQFAPREESATPSPLSREPITFTIAESHGWPISTLTNTPV